MKPLEVKSARQELGVSAVEMANLLGCTVAGYYKRESGVVKLSDVDKSKIAQRLKMSYEQMNRSLYDGVLPHFF